MDVLKKLIAAASAAVMLPTGIALPAGEAISAEAADAPAFVVSDAEAVQGDTVTVEIAVENDPGISSFRLAVDYDSEAMLLSAAEGSVITGTEGSSGQVFIGNTDKIPLIVSWFDGLHEDCTYNGTLALLTFQIPEDAAPGEYKVTLSYDPEDVFNTNYRNITFNTVSGKVTVIKKCIHSYVSTVVKPSCTTGGYTVHTCSECGDSYTDSETGALGHSYSSEITQKPSCTEDGIRTYTCSRCTDSYTEVVKAPGHSYVSEVIEPTEAEGGYTLHTCSVCGDSYTDSYTSPLPAEYALRGRASLVSTDPDTTELTVTAENENGIITEAEVNSDGSYCFKELAGEEFVITARCGKLYVPETAVFKAAADDKVMDFTLYLYGDCNSSGAVNMKDITDVQKYINSWDITLNRKAADLNADGEIRMVDLSTLQRFVNGWDVTFGK